MPNRSHIGSEGRKRALRADSEALTRQIRDLALADEKRA